ncbi:hypothetical protein VCR14J2_260410 [Vibrio coralliirubri]|uniref:hypothetical protein n=1 Tax=Vibrio coralliirubri TaxID=1516159 RepID=UPI00062EE8A8|nr:hypothetical protein [Vibrio coralliirubri]CDT98639.1 hypothetical protein VCR14J2_260410 [Vibrio coralliirubri]
MAVFVVTSASQGSAQLVEDAIKSAFSEDDVLTLGPLTWLINDENNSNPIAVSEKLGVLDSDKAGDIGPYIINQFSNYYGYHNNTIWDWLRAKGL